MSSRPPSINPPRNREIVRLRRLLADLDDILKHRRVEELADERSETVRALMAEQLAGWVSPQKRAPRKRTSIISRDQLLEKSGRFGSGCCRL